MSFEIFIEYTPNDFLHPQDEIAYEELAQFYTDNIQGSVEEWAALHNYEDAFLDLVFPNELSFDEFLNCLKLYKDEQTLLGSGLHGSETNYTKKLTSSSSQKDLFKDSIYDLGQRYGWRVFDFEQFSQAMPKLDIGFWLELHKGVLKENDSIADYLQISDSIRVPDYSRLKGEVDSSDLVKRIRSDIQSQIFRTEQKIYYQQIEDFVFFLCAHMEIPYEQPALTEMPHYAFVIDDQHQWREGNKKNISIYDAISGEKFWLTVDDEGLKSLQTLSKIYLEEIPTNQSFTDKEIGVEFYVPYLFVQERQGAQGTTLSNPGSPRTFVFETIPEIQGKTYITTQNKNIYSQDNSLSVADQIFVGGALLLPTLLVGRQGYRGYHAVQAQKVTRLKQNGVHTVSREQSFTAMQYAEVLRARSGNPVQIPAPARQTSANYNNKDATIFSRSITVPQAIASTQVPLLGPQDIRVAPQQPSSKTSSVTHIPIVNPTEPILASTTTSQTNSFTEQVSNTGGLRAVPNSSSQSQAFRVDPLANQMSSKPISYTLPKSVLKESPGLSHYQWQSLTSFTPTVFTYNTQTVLPVSLLPFFTSPEKALTTSVIGDPSSYKAQILPDSELSLEIDLPTNENLIMKLPGISDFALTFPTAQDVDALPIGDSDIITREDILNEILEDEELMTLIRKWWQHRVEGDIIQQKKVFNQTKPLLIAAIQRVYERFGYEMSNGDDGESIPGLRLVWTTEDQSEGLAESSHINGSEPPQLSVYSNPLNPFGVAIDFNTMTDATEKYGVFPFGVQPIAHYEIDDHGDSVAHDSPLVNSVNDLAEQYHYAAQLVFPDHVIMEVVVTHPEEFVPNEDELASVCEVVEKVLKNYPAIAAYRLSTLERPDDSLLDTIDETALDTAMVQHAFIPSETYTGRLVLPNGRVVNNLIDVTDPQQKICTDHWIETTNGKALVTRVAKPPYGAKVYGYVHFFDEGIPARWLDLTGVNFARVDSTPFVQAMNIWINDLEELSRKSGNDLSADLENHLKKVKEKAGRLPTEILEGQDLTVLQEDLRELVYYCEAYLGPVFRKEIFAGDLQDQLQTFGSRLNFLNQAVRVLEWPNDAAEYFPNLEDNYKESKPPQDNQHVVKLPKQPSQTRTPDSSQDQDIPLVRSDDFPPNLKETLRSNSPSGFYVVLDGEIQFVPENESHSVLVNGPIVRIYRNADGHYYLENTLEEKAFNFGTGPNPSGPVKKAEAIAVQIVRDGDDIVLDQGQNLKLLPGDNVTIVTVTVKQTANLNPQPVKWTFPHPGADLVELVANLEINGTTLHHSDGSSVSVNVEGLSLHSTTGVTNGEGTIPDGQTLVKIQLDDQSLGLPRYNIEIYARDFGGIEAWYSRSLYSHFEATGVQSQRGNSGVVDGTWENIESLINDFEQMIVDSEEQNGPPQAIADAFATGKAFIISISPEGNYLIHSPETEPFNASPTAHLIPPDDTYPNWGITNISDHKIIVGRAIDPQQTVDLTEGTRVYLTFRNHGPAITQPWRFELPLED